MAVSHINGSGWNSARAIPEDDDPQTPVRPHFYGNRITPELRRGQQRMIFVMALDAPQPG
jgi:hypothetical protein